MFAEGMDEEEKLGETIKMKGKAGLDTYKYIQTGAEEPAELTIPEKYLATTPYPPNEPRGLLLPN